MGVQNWGKQYVILVSKNNSFELEQNIWKIAEKSIIRFWVIFSYLIPTVSSLTVHLHLLVQMEWAELHWFKKDALAWWKIIKPKWHYSMQRVQDGAEHGLRTPNEGINQRNLKFWTELADKKCLGCTYKFGIGIWFSAV